MWVDATSIVKDEFMTKGSIRYQLGWSLESKLGDPRPHEGKFLLIDYEFKGKKQTFAAKQGVAFDFPPKAPEKK